MKVLVFEYNMTETGHRIPYAKLVADAVGTVEGAKAVVCFPDVLANTGSLEEYFPDKEKIDVRYYPIDSKQIGLGLCRNAARALWHQIKLNQPDYVLVPTADGIGMVMGYQSVFRRKQPIPIDALLMRFEHLTPGVSRTRRAKKWLEWKVMKLWPWSRILQLDPLAWSSCSDTVELCPDPVPTPITKDKFQSREILGLPQQHKIVASVGNQNEIKGVDRLLRAFHESTDLDCHLLLAGPMSKSVEALYEELFRDDPRLERITVWNRFLTEHEFQTSMIAADIIAVPYRRTERPSGVVCRAVSWDRPLVGTNHGWTNWACETLNAGVSVDTSNAIAFADAINEALQLAKTYEKTAIAKEFAAFNTVENFNHIWTRGIHKWAGQETKKLTISDQLLNSFRSI